MANLTYTVEIDWDANGCFDDTGEDVTSRVLDMTWRRGKGTPHYLSGRTRPGTARIILNNNSGDYSPNNTGSPLTGNLVPGRWVRIRTTGAGSIGTRWQGFISSIVPGKRSGRINTAVINCVGPLGYIANREVELAMQTSIRVDTALGLILDEINWPKDEQYDDQVNTDSPVGYWRFGETSGAAQDETANNNDGTIVGSVTQGEAGLLPSSTNGSYQFPGTGGHVDMGSPAILDDIFSGGGTIEAVVNADSDGENDGGRVFQKGSWQLSVFGETGGAMKLSFGHDFSVTSGTWETTSTVITTNQTHHVAVTYDRDSTANNPTIYVDGCSVAITETSTPDGTASTDSGNDLLVGEDATTLARNWDGHIDEPALYSSVLTAARIQAHAKAVRTWRDLDTALTTMNRYWTDRTTVLGALRALEQTEGGLIYEKKDGSIAFRKRDDRMANRSSSATFSDAAAAALTYQDIQQRDPARSIFNVFDTEVQLFTVGGSATLWTYSDSTVPYLAPSETETFIARYPVNDSPTEDVGVDAWTTSAENTDYDANSLEAGGGTDLSSSLTVTNTKFGESMEIQITNDHATLGAFLVNSGGTIVLQARGTPVSASDPIPIREEDATSQTTHGERTFQARDTWMPSVADARAWGKVNLDLYKDPQPSISITVPGNRTAGTLTELEDLDINDRITVRADGNAGLGFNQDWFIESERHRVTNRFQHVVTWDLSDTTATDLYWQLDVSQLGTETKLAR